MYLHFFKVFKYLFKANVAYNAITTSEQVEQDLDS